MNKRILLCTVFLMLGMVLGLLPLEAKAAESDFVIENGVLIEYNGPGGAVVVPDGVTAIGSAAFWHNPNVDEITSITLPDSVVELYNSAFGYCTGMKNIRLSKNLKKIGHWAFLHCSSLTNLTIPESVTHIAEGAFEGCVNLELLTLPPKFNPKNGTNVFWGWIINISPKWQLMVQSL